MYVILSIENVFTVSLYRRLGDEWIVLPQMMDQIEAFTCLMYGYPREKSVDSVRAIMLKKMIGLDDQLSSKSKVDLSRLPPCRDNLLAHTHRVNHRLGIYKRADQVIVDLPKPYDDCQGWEKTDGGILDPVWSYGPVLPPSLVDLLEATVNEAEERDEQDDDALEIDYDEIIDDYNDE